jgi:hypothetical protein
VSNQLWIAWIILALIVGLGVGLWLGGRSARAALMEARREFDKERAAQQQRSATDAPEQQAQVALEIERVKAQAQRQMDALRTEHRADSAKMSRLLADTHDEVAQLKAKLARKGRPEAPDTDQGFAATQPMQYPE